MDFWFKSFVLVMVSIRQFVESDRDRIWEIIQPVIVGGDTYIFAPDSSRDKMFDYWFSEDKLTFVALEDDVIVGTFFIKSNQPDLGSHIANAGYMVASEARSKGIGKLMCEWSLMEAKRLRYEGMQFNFVVQTNVSAVRLWESCGFSIVGEVPRAFRHSRLGLVNVYVMYRAL